MKYVAIKTNPVNRPSRLLRSNLDYVYRSAITIFKLFVLYEPFKFFSYCSSPFFIFGVSLWLRFLYLTVIEGSLRGAYIQSVIVGGVSLLIGFFFLCLGIIGELLAKNRQLAEEQLYFSRKHKNQLK